MSFTLTTDQIRARTKTVTRRIGWRFLKRGDLIRAVVKSRGLKKGETVEPIAVLRILDVRIEPLSTITSQPAYGRREVGNEGFADHSEFGTPQAFENMFCVSHRCLPCADVTRIEFEYVDAP